MHKVVDFGTDARKIAAGGQRYRACDVSADQPFTPGNTGNARVLRDQAAQTQENEHADDIVTGIQSGSEK